MPTAHLPTPANLPNLNAKSAVAPAHRERSRGKKRIGSTKTDEKQEEKEEWEERGEGLDRKPERLTEMLIPSRRRESDEPRIEEERGRSLENASMY